MLWLDYAAGIAMHAVVTSNPAEHRLQRLATASVADNRISYGCINVPAEFFDTVVGPLFGGAGGIVYVLPETRTIDAEFFRNVAAAAPATASPTAIGDARPSEAGKLTDNEQPRPARPPQ